MFLKRCSKCGQWKSKSGFHKSKNKKDGLCCWCKECYKIYHQENRERELVQKRKHYKKNKKKYNKLNREYHKSHKKEIAQNKHRYHLEHKEERREKDSLKRGLGYNPLNEPFEGSVAHHINNNDVVFIPKEVHEKSKVEAHRRVILEYYGSIEQMIKNDPI